MTLNLRRLVPIASGALIFLLSGCEETPLSRHIQEGESEGLGLGYGAIIGETAAVEAATLPDPNALYNAAVALGGDAQYTADRARSPRDWERAAMGWERALNFLKAIPQGSPMYSSARAKIIDYEKRLDGALGQIRRASTEGGAPSLAMADSLSEQSLMHRRSPAEPQANLQENAEINGGTHSNASAAVSPAECQVAAPGIADILLSDLQIESKGGEDLLTGCVTNRTQQPISAIALTYSHSDGDAAGRFQAPLVLNQDQLAPGETRAFQQSYGIEPQVDEVTLESATWEIGSQAPQQQEATLEVIVTRK